MTWPRVTWTSGDKGRLDVTHYTPGMNGTSADHEQTSNSRHPLRRESQHATQEEPANATRMKAKLKASDAKRGLRIHSIKINNRKQ